MYEIRVSYGTYVALQLDEASRVQDLGVADIRHLAKGAVVSGSLDQLAHFASFLDLYAISEDLGSQYRRNVAKDREKILAFVASHKDKP
jgi:hypothetical protein